MQDSSTSQSVRCGASCPQAGQQRWVVETLSSLCLAGLDQSYSLGKACGERADTTAEALQGVSEPDS